MKKTKNIIKYFSQNWGFVIPVLILIIWGCYWSFKYTVDDAFISFRYVQNFVNGNGIVYNVGEKVEGYTNFFWVAILSFFTKLGVSTLVSSKMIGLALGVLSFYIIFNIGRRYLSMKNEHLFMPLTISALFVPFVVSLTDGLETPLFFFLTYLMLYLFIKWVDSKNQKFLIWSSIIAGLAYLTRPEGIMFIFILVIGVLGDFIISKFGKKKTVEGFGAMFKNIFLCLFPALLIFSTHLFWRLKYYGYLWPNTFYAKGGGRTDLLEKGVSNTIVFLNSFGGWKILMFIVLAFIVVLWINRKHFYSLENFVIFLIILVISSRVIFNIWSGSAWMGEFRFLTPIIPIMLILVSKILLLYKNEFDKLPKTKILVYIFIFGLIGVAAAKYSFGSYKYHINYANGLEKGHIALGEYLKKNTDKGTILAVDDAGAIPYYSELTSIDMLGLNDKYIGHLEGEFYKKYDNNYVLSRNPNYIILITNKAILNSVNDLSLQNHKDMFLNNEFSKNYHNIDTYMFNNSYFLQVFIKNST